MHTSTEADDFDADPPFFIFADMLLGMIRFARSLAGVTEADPQREDKAVSDLVLPIVLRAVGNRCTFSDPEMILMFAGALRLAGEILESAAPAETTDTKGARS